MGRRMNIAVQHEPPPLTSASAMLRRRPVNGPSSVLLLMATTASILTPVGAQCHVVTIFGLKTADCNKQSAKVMPRTLDRDLQVVRFDDNRLTKLESDEFRIYPNLQEIYVARNHIESVSAKAFQGLFSLQILDLEGNQLTSVPSDSFQAISSLRMLSLKGNPIRRIETGALTSLRNVEEVNFENCWLDSIDRWAFRGLEKLVEINLVNNELIGLDPDMSSSLPLSLSVLRLYRNPWTCNCRLRWLRKWIAIPGSVNWDFATNTPTCAAPELIKGVAWKHLSPDQFACPTRIVFNDTRTSATVELGRNVTLECLAIGDPEPSVSWLRDGGKALPRGTIFAENRGPSDSGERLVTSVVTMLRVGHDQAGDYRCSAENSAGRSEMTYKVMVQELGASAVGSGRLDADRETLLGVIVGIGVLVAVIVTVTVCRVKVRQCQKREDIYVKNLTPLTKKKSATEEDEAGSEEEGDEEEEEEQDDSSFADSFKFQAKSIGNVKTDSTLQSLLGGRKSSNAVDVLSGRTEDFGGRESRAQGTHHHHHIHRRRQKLPQQRDPRPEEEEEEEDDVGGGGEGGESCKKSTGRKNRRSSVMFDDRSPSPSAPFSDKSDPSSPRTDSDNEKRKSPPDLLSGGGGGVSVGGCAGKATQRQTTSSRLQGIGCQQGSRPDRSVSFVPHEVPLKDDRGGSRLSFQREASSSAETLVIDDVTRRTVTSDSPSKPEESREDERGHDLGLSSKGNLSPTSVRFLTIDRAKEKTSAGLRGKVSLSCNTVHFPEHSSGQAELIKSSNCGTTAVEGNFSSLGKSCLRKKPSLDFTPIDDTHASPGTRSLNYSGVAPDLKRSKVDGGRRREEHERLLPQIPPSAVLFRDGPLRIRPEVVENGSIGECPRLGPHRDRIQNGVEGVRGSPGGIGGFMHDSLRWIEGSLQRMVEVGLPGTLTTNSGQSVDQSLQPGYQNSLHAANSTMTSPPITSSSKLSRETNRAFPTRPFDTLPIKPCFSIGQSSSRPDCPIVDFTNRTSSCLNQNYNQPSKFKRQPPPPLHLGPHHHQQQQQQQQQRQQHHVTLLSDILLSPFGKDSMTSSSNAGDVRTKADSRRSIVLDDDDDAGTAL